MVLLLLINKGTSKTLDENKMTFALPFNSIVQKQTISCIKLCHLIINLLPSHLQNRTSYE